MQTVNVQRTNRQGKAVKGTITIPLEQETRRYPTLENADFIIPAGTYPLRLTWSPRFKKLMPEIGDVPEREGIRCADTTLVHEPKYILAVSSRVCSASPKNVKFSGTPDFGTKPEHSTGCVLVSQAAIDDLQILFNQRKKWYEEEEMLICISDPDDNL